jgi:probable HAF family extracellular repeat protein
MRAPMRVVPLMATAATFMAVMPAGPARWAAAAPMLYSVTDLGAARAGFSEARAINNYGQVTGVMDYAFLWTPTTPNGTTGTTTDLGVLPDFISSNGYGINAYGQVVGASGDGAGPRGFLWTPSSANGTTGSMVDLGDLPGGNDDTTAAGINDSGQVTGRTNTFTGERAFLWMPATPHGTSGTMVDVGVLPGGAGSSTAFGINTSGQITGRSNASGGNDAVVWTPIVPNGDSGAMASIGRFPGGLVSVAYGINDSGQIVGLSDGTGINSHAFLWTPNTPNGSVGSMINLGDLPGGLDRSTAYGINRAGEVVGGANGDQRAFRWTPLDGMVDLNTKLDSSGATWRLVIAYGNNDLGQIVGIGSHDPDGTGPTPGAVHAFLLTPVPEPHGMLLFALSFPFILRCRQHGFR